MSTIDACPQVPFLQIDPTFRIFYAVYVATMAIFGITANAVLLMAIMKNSKYFLRIDIFHITISQTIIGFVYLSGFLTVAGPVIVNFYPHLTFLTPMIILSSLNSLAYYADQGFLLAIATNRLLHMCTNLSDKLIYRLTQILHLSAWCFGLFIWIVPHFFGCFKIFTPRLLSYTFSCSACLFAQTLQLCGTLPSWILSGIYLIIIIRIIFIKRDLQLHLSLTLQCFLITAPSLIGAFVFWFIFAWFPNNGYVGIFPTTLNGLIMFINPIVLFIFNDQVRKSMLSVLCKGKDTKMVSQTSKRSTSDHKGNRVQPR